MSSAPIPLIFVLGPTASGKTSLAVELALGLGGEVVNADAMAVYRAMCIGTAKATLEEQRGVPHHVLDCIEPEETCQVQRWLELAEAAIADIHGRGKAVIVAGGSPLYVKALLEGLSAGTPRDEAVRDELETRYDRIGGEAMLAELAEVDPDYASERHPNDKRRIVRALEVFRLSGKPYSSFHTTDGKRRSDYRTLLLGIRWDKEELHKRINARARAMFADGLIDEVRDLRDRLSQEARQAVGYKEVLELLDGSCDEEDARYRVQRNSRMLAKHQNTWYKRFRDLTWLDGAATDLSAQALKRARDFLAQEG